MLANNEKVDKYKFGEYLKSLRTAISGLTLRKAAFKAKVSGAYISQVERGIRDIPSPDILRKLAPVYKISYEELMVDAGYWHRSEIPDDPIIREKAMRYMEFYKMAEDAYDSKISPEQFKKVLDLLKETKKQG